VKKKILWSIDKMKTTQTEKLIRRLETGKNLTVNEARSRYGIQRLSARIHELRNEGYEIDTNTVVASGRKVTAYKMA
jgi:biotin operon repressor